MICRWSPSRLLRRFLPTFPVLSALSAIVSGSLVTSDAVSPTNSTIPDFVTKYAPLVWLHSEDPFRPSDILTHVHHTTPILDGEPIADLPELDLDNLALLNEFGDEVALTSSDNVTSEPQAEWFFGEAPNQSGEIHNATSCVVILVEKTLRDFDVFYFYFYSYDRGPNISQVLEPLDRIFDDDLGGLHFGDHVGDWENNMIRFRDGKPTGIYYSQHSSGHAYDWSDRTLSMVGDRPLVYSAYGSHANYPSPGNQTHDEAVVDYCDAGMQWDPVLSAYFYHLDPTRFTLTRLFPPGSTDLSSNLTSFLYFTGRWGDHRYPDEDPRQMTVPHFGLKRFETGPTGPRAKQLVRKGLYPDHRHQKSWTQWVVSIFMSLYPCCIKGWRVWVSGLFVIAILVGLVVATTLGVRRGVNRYKMRGYKKVQTEIPMDDLDRP